MSYQKRVVIGDCILYLGNSYELIDHVEKFDAIVTDGPYEIETSGGGHFRKKRDNLEKITAAGINEGFDFEILSPLFGRCTSCVAFCSNEQLPELSTFLKRTYKRYIIIPWIKTNPVPFANKNYAANVEWYVEGWQDEEYQPYYIHAWDGDAYPLGDFKDKQRYFMSKNGADKSVKHPTPKPIDLMEKIIKNVNGNVIMDCFMGSASTALACINLGKKFIGIEINPVFFEEAVERIKNHKKIIDTTESTS